MSIFTVTREKAQEEGHACFNNGLHTIVELDHLEKGSMHTISIKLPNGQYLTTCIIPFDGDSGTIDFKYHGTGEQRVIGFRNGKSEEIKADLYTLEYRE